MQSSIRVIVSLVLLSSALASFDNSMKLRRDGGFSNKLRRDGVLNLYPFPRVGRASKNTWQIPMNDFLLDYEPLEKRQLYAFPRVGRSDLSILREGHQPAVFQPSPVRRSANSGGDSPGMWFGPRLGRSFKSDDDDVVIENEIDHSEPEQIDSTNEIREKQEANVI